MVDFTINNIALTPLSVSDIPDTIATSGEQTSLEIKGLSPVIPAAPWQVNWSDNFTGHQVQTIVRFQGLEPYTQIGARDRSYHLERRYIFGTFQGPFADVIDLLLVAGECLNWFPFPEIRLSADNLAKIVNVYLQGQTAREGIVKAIGQLGIQAEVKVRVDTGFLEIASSDQAEPAPIPLIDVGLLYTNCPEERRIIFDLVQNRAFLPASEVTVLGRLGIYANASGENNTRNEYLVYKSDGTLVTYDTLNTADRVLSILVETVDGDCVYVIVDTLTTMVTPAYIAIDSDGNKFVSQPNNATIRRIDGITEVVTIVMGVDASAGFIEPTFGIAASGQKLGFPSPIEVDDDGNLYYGDENFTYIGKITPAGIVTKFLDLDAYYGDASTQAYDLKWRSGFLYICDRLKHCVLKTDGTTTTVFAGTSGTAGNTGDTGAATSARLQNPTGIFFDSAGNLYIYDDGNYRIRKVNASDGKINAFAGLGVAPGAPYIFTGNKEDIDISFFFGQLIVDQFDNIYFTAGDYQLIRKIDTGGVVTIIAGKETNGYTGDGGPPLDAEFNYNAGGCLGIQAGNCTIYVADENNDAIRTISEA